MRFDQVIEPFTVGRRRGLLVQPAVLRRGRVLLRAAVHRGPPRLQPRGRRAHLPRVRADGRQHRPARARHDGLAATACSACSTTTRSARGRASTRRCSTATSTEGSARRANSTSRTATATASRCSRPAPDHVLGQRPGRHLPRRAARTPGSACSTATVTSTRWAWTSRRARRSPFGLTYGKDKSTSLPAVPPGEPGHAGDRPPARLDDRRGRRRQLVYTYVDLLQAIAEDRHPVRVRLDGRANDITYGLRPDQTIFTTVPLMQLPDASHELKRSMLDVMYRMNRRFAAGLGLALRELRRERLGLERLRRAVRERERHYPACRRARR